MVTNAAAIEVPRRSWENSRTAETRDIRSFEDFWPQYVRQHAHPRTRIIHATGSVLAVFLFGAAFAINVWLLVLVPLTGYAFAWSSHFFIDHNKPAPFAHPLYSLAAEYRMVFLMMAGRMDEEVAKAGLPIREASGPVSPADSRVP